MTLPVLPPSTKDYQEIQSYADLLWVIRAVLIYIVTVMVCSRDRLPQQFRHASAPRKESPSIPLDPAQCHQTGHSKDPGVLVEFRKARPRVPGHTDSLPSKQTL